MPNKRKGLADTIEAQINWRKIEKTKNDTIKKVRYIVDEELRMQLVFDPNYIMYHTRIQKELGITEKHLYNPFVDDIYRKYQNDHQHYKDNQRKVYALLMKTRCPFIDKWVQDTVDQLETIGIRIFEKPGSDKRAKKTYNGMIRNNFIKKDYFQVLSKQEWDEFVQVRDDKKFSVMGKANIGRPAWNSKKRGASLKDRDPVAYKRWQERLNKGKAKLSKTRKERKKKNPMYGVVILSEEKKKQKAINISKALTGKKKSASHKQNLSATRKKLFALDIIQSPIKGKKRKVVNGTIKYV